MKNTVSRVEFIKGFVRIVMLGILAFISFSVGKRAITEGNCSGCPGKGICNGEADCGLFGRMNGKKI